MSPIRKSRYSSLVATCLTALPMLWIWSGLCLADNNDSGINGKPKPPIVDSTTIWDSVHGIWPLGFSLPAISKNGREVAFSASRSEYNDSGWQELRIVSRDGKRKRVVLEKYEPTPRSPRQAKAMRKVAKKAKAMLDAGTFTPLVEYTYPDGYMPHAMVGEIEKKPMRVSCWQLTYREASRTLVILDKKGKQVFSRQVAMEKPFYCCSEADQGDKCTVGYTNVQAWGNDKVVFVIGEYWGYPDGCEIDYHYWIIWPAEGKGHLETNQ